MVGAVTHPNHLYANQRSFKPALRFGSVFSSERYRTFQNLLNQVTDKGRALCLPDVHMLPSQVKGAVKEASQNLSLSQLKTELAQQRFGVAEEASDALFFVLAKLALHQNILPESRRNQFLARTKPMFHVPSGAQCQKILDEADKEVTVQDTHAFLQYCPYPFSQSSGATERLRQFLAVILSDEAIHRHVFQGSWFNEASVNAKLAEELEEYEEELSKHGVTETLTLPDSVTVDGYQKLLARMISLGQRALKSNTITLDSLLHFQELKNHGRYEQVYMNPQVSWQDMKPQAKAWEKLLEAHMFLV